MRTSLQTFKNVVSKEYFVVGFLMLICALISMQGILQGPKDYWGGTYTHYNNYVIFKQSFIHLAENKNLYDFYLHEHADLYKYSPSFALLMAVFYALPDWVGLFLWNLLNMMVLYLGIKGLPKLTWQTKIAILMVLFFELITATQNTQSNALLAGLIMLAYNQFERGKTRLASLFLIIGIFIKIYSVVGCLLFLFYPDKLKSLAYMLLWSVLIFLIPLLVVDFSSLLKQYQNWYVLLRQDQSESIGMSIYIYTQLFLPSNSYKIITLLFGSVLLLGPLVKWSSYSNQQFRFYYMALILLWIVLFNHKAESPTYIIAMTGVALWYTGAKKEIFNKILLWGTVFFCSLWFTDLVPKGIKGFVDPVYVKAFFPALVLGVVYAQLISTKEQKINSLIE